MELHIGAILYGRAVLEQKINMIIKKKKRLSPTKEGQFSNLLFLVQVKIAQISLQPIIDCNINPEGFTPNG